MLGNYTCSRLQGFGGGDGADRRDALRDLVYGDLVSCRLRHARGAPHRDHPAMCRLSAVTCANHQAILRTPRAMLGGASVSNLE